MTSDSSSGSGKIHDLVPPSLLVDSENRVVLCSKKWLPTYHNHIGWHTTDSAKSTMNNTSEVVKHTLSMLCLIICL